MDAFIDPLTRDYSGDRDPADGLANACYLRLETPLGSWWADKGLGSLLHTLRREKDVLRVRRLAKQYAEQALARLSADGRAKSITVTAEQPRDGRLYLLIEVVDAGGNSFAFKYPVKVI